MCARQGTSTMFGDWKQIVSESHIFFPVKCPVEDILPCIHVLCSSCLEMIQRRTGKKSGDKMDCKVCKLDFVIPSSKVLRERKVTRELLSELSIAANDITQWCEICSNTCRPIYRTTGNEMIIDSATVYCTWCRKNGCKRCAEMHCRFHQTVAKRSHLTGNLANKGNHDRHKIRIEVSCIACDKGDCLLCLFGNVSYSNRDDLDEAIDTELQSLDALSKQLSTSKAQVKEQIRDFQSSVMMVKNMIEANYREQISAIENQTMSLLNQLRSINTGVNQQLERNRDIIDELSKKADTYRKSCASSQSMGTAEEKFYAVGAAHKKINDLKTELDSAMKLRRPIISYESTDLNRPNYFEISKIEVQWIDERSGDEGIIDADKNTSKDETAAETDGDPYALKQQVQSSTKGDSRERSENASATFSLHTKQDPNHENREDRENSFPEALAKYNEMLKKMRDKLFPDNYRRNTTYRRTSLSSEKDAEDLRQQFDQVRSIRSDKGKTTQWANIERCHEQLVSLASRQVDDDCFKKIIDEIEDMLKQTTAAIDKKKDDTRTKTSGSLHESGPPQSGPPSMRENRYQEGLRNFGNTCYFNAVIQCLCQTSSLLTDLSPRNMSDQPLTEAFVQFWNHRCVDSADQNEAFSEFFQQLFTSSPKFNNYSQHDSHDLFIHFLNDLRSEERRSNVDPKKVLTAVDKVFGGHFITMYACLDCNQPYFVCECLLDISLPICRPIHKQQYYSGGGSGIASQESRQLHRDATVYTDQNTASYSEHGNKLKRGFLEALNEEQNMPTNQGGGGYRATPVTLTECLQFYTEIEHIPEGYLCLSCQDVNQSAAAVSAQSMPPAKKRTLIYNPPATLVLHMKRFERTATGFTKRSDRVVYEEFLDLGPYCSSDCLRIDPNDKNVWYSLYGVVVHIGTLQCGHYMAYVKIRDSNATAMKTFLQEEFLDREQVAIEQNIKFNRESKRVNRKVEWHPERKTGGRWIYVSDSYARDVSSQEALNQEAFMLFYERVPKHGQEA